MYLLILIYVLIFYQLNLANVWETCHVESFFFLASRHPSRFSRHLSCHCACLGAGRKRAVRWYAVLHVLFPSKWDYVDHASYAGLSGGNLLFELWPVERLASEKVEKEEEVNKVTQRLGPFWVVVAIAFFMVFLDTLPKRHVSIAPYKKVVIDPTRPWCRYMFDTSGARPSPASCGEWGSK